ncbi:cytochrome P450 [Streptomyces sp. NPDC049881]|uniref:cytochrome P450 n=1 Tax=Streptomyces sp. NPDC049881 TaxID=3155778 RepID=UPI00342816B8
MPRPAPPTSGPSSDIDLFSHATLTDPYPAYATLRDLGPAVHLPRHDIWALPRYDEALAVLKDSDTFVSDEAVALTDLANTTILKGTVLAADGPVHARLRRPLSRQLGRRALAGRRPDVHELADATVRRHVAAGTFDAAEMVREFVAGIVLEWMGLPEVTRDTVLDAAAAIFDAFGPESERYFKALPVAGAMAAFLAQEVTRDKVRPDSWLGALYDAADEGLIHQTDVVPLMSAYVAAGLDTTILGLTTTLRLLAEHPEQYERLRGETPASSPVGAFTEALRIEAPVQGFGRKAARDTHIGDIAIPAGSQVWILYGSTGRDARKWGDTADTFDIDRPDSADHLTLGAGAHTCAGNHLATLQGEALLTALAAQVPALKPAGTPEREFNQVLRGHATLPLTVA